MNYKIYDRDEDTFFKYMPMKKILKNNKNISITDSPFEKLTQLNLK